MLLNSRPALATAGSALRGAAASAWRGGVSSGSVFMPTACAEYTSSVEHAWEAMMGSVPRREYASCRRAWRSWPGVGVARFSSTAMLPEPDIVLTAMKTPAVREPGGLHATLDHLGLEEAVRYLPPELPRGSFPETAAALALACPALRGLLRDLDEQAWEAAAREIVQGMEKLLFVPAKEINQSSLEGMFNVKTQSNQRLLYGLLSDQMKRAVAAADAAAAAAKKRAEEKEAAAKKRAEDEATWASALSSARVSNTVLPLREVLLDSAAGQEYMPEAGHRQAVRHMLGWKLGLGEAIRKGEKGVLEWFREAKAALQREHGGRAGDAGSAAGDEGASQHAMDITGLNPVIDKNGEVVALATRFLPPVNREGLKQKDVQREYGICAVTDGQAVASLHPLTHGPDDPDFVHVPAVRPRLDGSLELLSRQPVRTLSIVWTPERIAFLASCAQALVSEGTGHLLTGVHGCGKSTTLAALVSIAAVGLGADVLYVRDGSAFVSDERNTLLRGLSTSAGDALRGDVLHKRMWPLLGSPEEPAQVVLDVLTNLYGLPVEEPLRSPRLVVVDEVNDLYRDVNRDKPSMMERKLNAWCNWKGRHEDVGTMRVLASSPDTSLEVTIKDQMWPVFYELGPTTINIMAAVLRSGADAELSLPGAGVDGATSIPTERELEEALQYLGCIPRAIGRYCRNLQHMGHREALFLAYSSLLQVLVNRILRQHLETGVSTEKLTWPTITAATWGVHVGGQLSTLVNASMVSRINVRLSTIAGNALFVSLAARHALLRVLTSPDHGSPDRQELSNLLGLFPSNQETLERDVVALMSLGACGHRALGVGQKFVHEEVQQLFEYPTNQSTRELMEVMSPSSLYHVSRLQTLLDLSNGEEDVDFNLGGPPNLLRLESPVVRADDVASLRNIGKGESWVIQTWKNSPGVDALLVYHDKEGVKHAVLVEVTSSNLYAHAKGKTTPAGVPPGLRDIAQVVLSEESRHELLEDGSLKMSHTVGSKNAPASGGAGTQGSDGRMSVVNSWLQLIDADVRMGAEQLSGSDAGGAAEEAGGQQASGDGKYKRLRVTTEPVEGVSKPEWRVHMLYVTRSNIDANKTYLEQCANFLDSPLVHAMMGGDCIPAPSPSAKKPTKLPIIKDSMSSDASKPSELSV